MKFMMVSSTIRIMSCEYYTVVCVGMVGWLSNLFHRVRNHQTIEVIENDENVSQPESGAVNEFMSDFAPTCWTSMARCDTKEEAIADWAVPGPTEWCIRFLNRGNGGPMDPWRHHKSCYDWGEILHRWVRLCRRKGEQCWLLQSRLNDVKMLLDWALGNRNPSHVPICWVFPTPIHRSCIWIPTWIQHQRHICCLRHWETCNLQHNMHHSFLHLS